jgi:hypothetical protein
MNAEIPAVKPCAVRGRPAVGPPVSFFLHCKIQYGEAGACKSMWVTNGRTG